MNKEIFRKKSLERINSPEKLDSYLKVVNFPIWLTIIAIILLLIGAIIWGIVGKVETRVNGTARVQDGVNICYVSGEYISDIYEGTTLYIEENKYTVTGSSERSVPAESVMSEYCMELGGFTEGQEVYALEFAGNIDDGNYQCRIVIEEISPITFMFDSND